eukprot:TRINITY_DN12293_c2_g4_i3.p4 TRINITY_DN12293_c2_g4~~TRINITY_DN12293_c2_g4_i3.p4  ORF type:complete len:109 (-),score=2.89 TRINITY_DN12293_c2_g4_i3:2009-2335(-)
MSPATMWKAYLSVGESARCNKWTSCSRYVSKSSRSKCSSCSKLNILTHHQPSHAGFILLGANVQMSTARNKVSVELSQSNSIGQSTVKAGRKEGKKRLKRGRNSARIV